MQLDRHTEGGLEPGVAQGRAGAIGIRLRAGVPYRDGHPLGERRLAGPFPQPLLLLPHQLGPLVGRAGPAKLSVGVGQHEANPVGAEQRPRGHHDLLERGRQAAFEVQIVQLSDTGSQGSRVDLHC
jgi:hypothetical protein